jgi:hypothetical protein
VAVEVGDAVQFERAGQAFSGKVTAIRAGGKFVEVETVSGGRTRKLIVAATSVTPLAKPGGRALRTWSDSTGRFKIEASLESRTAFEVILLKRDGATIKVPLEKLSVADQEYLAGLDSNNENPFETGVAAATVPPVGVASAPSGGGGGSLALPEPVVFRAHTKLVIQSLSPPEGIEADPSPLDFSSVNNAGMNLPPIERRE